MTARSTPYQRGVSFVELVISMVIIGIAVAGVMAVTSRTTEKSADPMILHQAEAVGEAYLEEILLKPFCDPDTTCQIPAPCPVCPAPEASRDLYDNVCDYNGTSDSPPRDQNDNPIAALGAYTVTVTVDSTDTLNGLSGANCELLRVDVRITHANSDVDITLSGYRTNFEAL